MRRAEARQRAAARAGKRWNACEPLPNEAAERANAPASGVKRKSAKRLFATADCGRCAAFSDRAASPRLRERDSMKKRVVFVLAAAGFLATSAAPVPASYTVLIRGGTIYDGSGGTPYVGDVALKGDRIVYVGPHAPGH